MEPPNLDFFGLGLKKIFLMLMVYRIGLVGKLLSYVNSIAVKYLSLAWSLFYGVIWFMLWSMSANLFQMTKFQWIFRGAPLSDMERKELNLKAGRLIQSLGISIDIIENKFDVLREKRGYFGYANYYIHKCWDKSELKNKADVTVYKQLLEIDSKLGTTQSEQLSWCVFNSLRIDLIKAIDMDQVDFGYVGLNGFTIYRSCFETYLKARFILKRPEAKWKKIVTKTETVFHFLVEKGNKHGFNVNSILEIPTSNGSTCFSEASQCSKKIMKYIIGRGIELNSIKTNMMVPEFKYPDLAVPMMERGINPHVINYNGDSQIDIFPSSFESDEAKQLLCQFPRSNHFSIDDINCENTCRSDCPSSFKKFYFKNGEFVKMTEGNRIGQGGFGSVFKGSFHGADKAMKCVLIGKILQRDFLNEAVSDLEKNIFEIRIQMASGGSGIIFPEAFVRQQNQKKDDNGKWIAKNYNIYVYPIYDCNLYELHKKNFDVFTEEILGNIIHQCFIRNG